MSSLASELRIARLDDVYQLLVDAYTGLTEREIAAFHACLAMLLINQIGNTGVIGEIIATAAQVARRRSHS